MHRPKPVILLILDGFGVAPPGNGNAIAEAKMPIFRHLIDSYPAMTVQANGAAVGLSWGEMGNSEVGHLTIGAGKIFYQSLPRINLSIESREFFAIPALKKAITQAKAQGKAIHLMGLISQGNVHASQEHLHALLDFCAQEQCKDVYIHGFLDGRDAIYNSAVGFITELEQKIASVKVGKIATLAGRYYAMDRDNRWDRVQLAYDAMVLGKGDQANNALEALQNSYAKQVFDEQVLPTVIMEGGKPVATIQAGDSVIFFNFRPDRARELTKAFALPTFDKFPRTAVESLFFVTFTEYEKDLPVEVAFPPQPIDVCLAKVISDAGLTQLHIAETEKYAHVTFFLNGMREEEFPGEQRAIIPSPRVSSYDKQPEMSVFEIADRVVKDTAAGTFDFIAINFANADMVGHTGNEAATVAACEAIDTALGKIVDTALTVGGAVVITADHGNAEEVTNLTTGEMDKEHSTNSVPLLVIHRELEGMKAPSGDVMNGDLSLVPPIGMLADVAPTILKLLQLPQPPEMTGNPLI
ncbi:2,3-bisphosphoglycerate-independent phosphoglycerate mutase [Patescibacteria group bacterium]|nr:2,3-bisphosphoglycerate-independent phosphoglycerate mutase [Patescibacteria group bacterium]